jgi:5-methylcytosine-specific restriction endonuclease McrA
LNWTARTSGFGIFIHRKRRNFALDLRRAALAKIRTPMNRPCSSPGCPRIVAYPARYCAAHEHREQIPARDYDRHRRATTPALANAAALRSSAAWRRLRRIKLAANPLCEDPLGDHARRASTATAQQVHHVLPLATHPEHGLDLSNLMSVCTRCHAKLEREAKR